MSSAVSMIGPKFYAWDSATGKPLAFGKVYTYAAGTNTPKPTWKSEDGVTQNTNPVILNAAGYADIYLRGRYKIVVKDADDVEVWTSDPVSDASQLLESWINETSATQVAPDQFKVTGNLTDVFYNGRSVKIDDATTFYGTIASTAYLSGETFVTISADTVLTSDLSRVWVSVVDLKALQPAFVELGDTLANGKGALLVRGSVIYVDTIADLQALDTSTLVDGQVAKITTTGRAGDFVIKSGTPPSDPQEGIYVVLAANRYAERVYYGEVSVKWFGAAGDGIVDDTAAFKGALATQKNVFAPDGTYLITDTIEINLQLFRGQNANRTTLLFNHTNGGFGATVFTSERGGGIENVALDANVDGLKGLNLSGTVIAKCDQVFINNFTQTSLQLGNTAKGLGIYWSKIGRVRIRLDSDKNGVTGVLIDGGAIPGSNANSLEDVVIGGNFQRPLHIKGVGNYIKSGTIELTRGTENVISMIYIEGNGNTIFGMYVEPVAGAPPETLVEFGPGSSGNSIEIWPQYVPPYNTLASIIDNGGHNKVKLRRPGANFNIGPEAEPSQNLIMNSAFLAWRDAENPVGWLFGTTGRISRVAPEAVGGPAILRMTLAGDIATIQTYLTNYFGSTSGAIPLDMEYLRGKPCIAGVWCRTNIAGAGSVKFNRGVGSIASSGEDSHSGSGGWELLLAHGNVTESHDRVGMELRSQKSNQVITGTVDFRDPFFVIGTDVPYFSPKPVIDTGGKMFGDLEFPVDYNDKALGGVIKLNGSYLWVDTTGDLRIGTSRPTDANWDTAGAVVGSQT